MSAVQKPWKIEGSLVYVNAGGRWRKVGYIKGERFISTPMNRSEHYMRNFSGWGMCTALIHELIRRNVESIELIVTGEGSLTSPTSLWLKEGSEYKNPHFEDQMMLRESLMEKYP